MKTTRISRRGALGGAAAAGAALLASTALAQSGTETPSAARPVPAPGDPVSPVDHTWTAAGVSDVLVEHYVAPEGALSIAPAAVAAPLGPFGPDRGPFHVRFGPISVAALREQLKSARADRDFAAGKMELGGVDALLASAETLIGQAEAKQPAEPTPTTESPRPGVTIQRIGPVAISREARLAAAQIRAARAQMEAALGGVLPSQAGPVGGELTHAHRFVADTAALVKENADAAGLIGQAQALYKQAYDAYGAGQYDRAAASARAAVATAQAARLTAEPTRPPASPATPSAPPPPTF